MHFMYGGGRGSRDSTRYHVAFEIFAVSGPACLCTEKKGASADRGKGREAKATNGETVAMLELLDDGWCFTVCRCSLESGVWSLEPYLRSICGYHVASGACMCVKLVICRESRARGGAKICRTAPSRTWKQ